MSKTQPTIKPSLGALSFMLRNPETWPADFVWNFALCSNCAMGLARLAWPTHVSTPSPGIMSNVFELPAGIAMALFTGGRSDTSAADVADRIDEYMAHYHK